MFRLTDHGLSSLGVVLLLGACAPRQPGASEERVNLRNCAALSNSLDGRTTYSLAVSGASGQVVLATLGSETVEFGIGFRAHHSEPAELEPTFCEAHPGLRDLFLSSASLVGGSPVRQDILSLDPNEKVLNASVALATHSPAGFEVSYIRDELRMQCFLDAFNRLLAACDSGVEVVWSEMPIVYVATAQDDARSE